MMFPNEYKLKSWSNWVAYFGMIIKEAEGNLCEYVDIHLINV